MGSSGRGRVKRSYAEYRTRQWQRLTRHCLGDRREAERLLSEYIEVLEVPLGERFAKRCEKSESWYEGSDRRGRPLRLSEIHILGHLLGDRSIAIARTGFTSLVMIDLDAHDVEAEETLLLRLGAVETALRHAPYTLIRSSSSRGLHVVYSLTESWDSDAVHAYITDALHRRGVEIGPGIVEAYPGGAQRLRLPLGRGSCVLDPDTLAPIAAREITYARRSPRGTLQDIQQLRRDIDESIHALTERIESNRVDLTRLVGEVRPEVRTRGVAQGGGYQCVELCRSPESGLVRGSGPLRGQAYRADVSALSKGISAPGLRRDQSRRMLWDLYIRQGLPREEVLDRYQEWLRHAEHDSNDLQDRPDQTIRKMLRDAPRYLDHLDQGIRCGRLNPGLGGRRPWDAAMTEILETARSLGRGRPQPGTDSLLLELHRQAQSGIGWKDLMRSLLSEADRRRVEQPRGSLRNYIAKIAPL